MFAMMSASLKEYAAPAPEASISVVIVRSVTAVTFLPPEAADSKSEPNPSVSPPSTV